MREALFARPRPMPVRQLPIAAGGALVALALPVCAVAGLSLRGWALGAVLWASAQALGLLFARLTARFKKRHRALKTWMITPRPGLIRPAFLAPVERQLQVWVVPQSGFLLFVQRGCLGQSLVDANGS